MFDYEAVLIEKIRERHPEAYVASNNPTLREGNLPRITIQRSGGAVGRFTEIAMVTTRVAAETQLEALDLVRTVAREYFAIRDEVNEISAIEPESVNLVSSNSHETMYQTIHLLTLNV